MGLPLRLFVTVNQQGQGRLEVCQINLIVEHQTTVQASVTFHQGMNIKCCFHESWSGFAKATNY
jgi:hypothetical protein